jgi:hypothetical protein
MCRLCFTLIVVLRLKFERGVPSIRTSKGGWKPDRAGDEQNVLSGRARQEHGREERAKQFLIAEGRRSIVGEAGRL